MGLPAGGAPTPRSLRRTPPPHRKRGDRPERDWICTEDSPGAEPLSLMSTVSDPAGVTEDCSCGSLCTVGDRSGMVWSGTHRREKLGFPAQEAGESVRWFTRPAKGSQRLSSVSLCCISDYVGKVTIKTGHEPAV